jgi:hypothetical protein
MATVTAAGYRHTSCGWKLIATKRIGQASQWFWYPAEACSLTVTQLKPGRAPQRSRSGPGSSA